MGDEYNYGQTGISIYSVMMAILFFSTALTAAIILRRRKAGGKKCPYTLLIWITILGAARLLIPLDLSQAVKVESERIFPWVQNWFLLSIRGVPVWKLTFVIWAAGSAVFVLFGGWSLWREYQDVGKCTAAKHEQVLRVLNKLQLKRAIVAMSEKVEVPKVIGIRKAHIYLPELSVSDEEMELIIKHEYQHYIGKDFLIKLLYMVLSALLWWNPIIHIFRKDLEYLLELRCDGNVTKDMEQKEKISYVEMILKVMRQTKEREKSYAGKAANLFRRDIFIRQRFEILLGEEEREKRRMIPFVFVAVIFLLSYFVIIQPRYPNPPEKDLLYEVPVSSENAYILKRKDGIMEMWINGEMAFVAGEEDLKHPPGAGLKIIEEE